MLAESTFIVCWLEEDRAGNILGHRAARSERKPEQTLLVFPVQPFAVYFLSRSKPVIYFREYRQLLQKLAYALVEEISLYLPKAPGVADPSPKPLSPGQYVLVSRNKHTGENDHFLQPPKKHPELPLNLYFTNQCSHNV